MHIRSRRLNYHSYLLRLWRADGLAPWQASLQSTVSGEIRHFADVESLWAFVQAHVVTDTTDQAPPAKRDPP